MVVNGLKNGALASLKAINLRNDLALNETKTYEVKPVLKSMKTIDPNAEYYMLVGENVVLFVKTHLKEEQEYEIEDKKYRWLGTTTIGYFEKEELNGNFADLQLSLF